MPFDIKIIKRSRGKVIDALSKFHLSYSEHYKFSVVKINVLTFILWLNKLEKAEQIKECLQITFKKELKILRRGKSFKIDFTVLYERLDKSGTPAITPSPPPIQESDSDRHIEYIVELVDYIPDLPKVYSAFLQLFRRIKDYDNKIMIGRLSESPLDYLTEKEKVGDITQHLFEIYTADAD